MKYEVKKRTIGPNNSLNITPQQFEDLREAHEGSVELLAIEEKFNILLENYAEFEQVLLKGALRRMLFASFEWSHSINQLHEINRSLVNLLSTCRLYLDHIPHNLNQIFKGDQAASKVLKNQTALEYDTHVGYRVMEAMRNYSQHRTLPLHKLENGVKPENGLIKHYVKVSVDVSKLAKDPEVKQKVVDELRVIGEYVDLKPLVREYLESFMRLHATVRELVKDRANEYERIISEAQEQYRISFGEEPTTLGAFAIDDMGNNADEIPIFDKPLRRWEFLVSKNMSVLNLRFHFVTSEAET